MEFKKIQDKITENSSKMKCAIFKMCAEMALCKRVVCSYLRAKHMELPPIIVETFFALMAVLIAVMIYLIYHLYENCVCLSRASSDAATELVPSGAANEVVPSGAANEVVSSGAATAVVFSGAANKEVQPEAANKEVSPNKEEPSGGEQGDVVGATVRTISEPKLGPVRISHCPPSRGIFPGLSRIKKTGPTNDNSLCRKQLSKLLYVSKKCRLQKSLQAWFQNEQYQIPHVNFQPTRKHSVTTNHNVAESLRKSSTFHNPLPGPSVSGHGLKSPEQSNSSCKNLSIFQKYFPQFFPWDQAESPIPEEEGVDKGRRPCYACSSRHRASTPADCYTEKSVVIKVMDYLRS